MKLLIILLALVALGVTTAQAEGKVTVCHATGSESNPYVEVTVSLASMESGHSPHAVHADDKMGECMVLTSTITVTPHGTHHTETEPVGSSIIQGPSDEPDIPMAFPASGGAPK